MRGRAKPQTIARANDARVVICQRSEVRYPFADLEAAGITSTAPIFPL